jgi:hypothetical protein
LLVLLGISYYYLTKHPPTSSYLVKNSSTTQNPTYSANSTPAANSSANPSDAAGAQSTHATDNTGAHRATDEANENTHATDAPKGGDEGAAKGGVAAPGNSGALSHANSSAPSHANSSVPAPARGGAPATAGGGVAAHTGGNSTSASGGNSASATPGAGRSNALTSAGGSTTINRSRHPDNGRPTGAANEKGLAANKGAGRHRGNDVAGTPEKDAAAGNNLSRNSAAPTTTFPDELVRSTLQGLHPIKEPAVVSDSALRAFTLKSTPPGPIRRNVLVIKRNWQFGITAAPDFASVNSLAGDKPGSSVGLTVDYQFAPRWYISSGLLLDRRNYAARSQDFHASSSFYTNNNIDPAHVDFVKGSFELLEIPLNLRYDFSVTGSTLFFASAGVSSYVLATENGNCYVNWYGQEVPKGFHYPSPSDYLFSVMNLSLGVETGISNSMSLLIAPYMKMPLRTIGTGQVQMSSVGLSFSLKWAPVTSRRRR